MRCACQCAIHNFHIRRADGTTAAGRFFGRAHAPLFEKLTDRVPLPPPPRRTSSAQAALSHAGGSVTEWPYELEPSEAIWQLVIDKTVDFE